MLKTQLAKFDIITRRPCKLCSLVMVFLMVRIARIHDCIYCKVLLIIKRSCFVKIKIPTQFLPCIIYTFTLLLFIKVVLCLCSSFLLVHWGTTLKIMLLRSLTLTGKLIQFHFYWFLIPVAVDFKSPL